MYNICINVISLLRNMRIQSHYLKKIAIRSILLIQATWFFYDNIAQARSYPVKEISKPSCKADHWNKLSADCKMKLPIIAKANYSAYQNDQMARLVYSVLRGGTYSDWRDRAHGAHEWIDITSSEGTPIYAIEDGEVVRARSNPGYGNLITIKHTLNNGNTVYSINGHLETMIVKEGSKVSEWQQIGTMGHEWMARGNHLHFAINTTKDNTYAFMWCGDYPKTDDYTIVEKGLCRESLFARTVDPIAFIEANWLIPSATLTTSTSKVISKNITQKTRRPLVALPPVPEKPVVLVTTVNPSALWQTPTVTKPVTTPTVTTVKASTSFSSSTVKSSDTFLKTSKIGVVSNFGTTMKKWSSSTIWITITNNDGKKFTWVLDKEISITPSKQNVSLSPRVIRYVSEWLVISFIEAKEVGTSELVVSYGDTVIGKLVVTVQ